MFEKPKNGNREWNVVKHNLCPFNHFHSGGLVWRRERLFMGVSWLSDLGQVAYCASSASTGCVLCHI